MVKVGRKKKGISNKRFMVIRVDDVLVSALNRYCKVIELNKSEFARQALEELLVKELRQLHKDIKAAKSIEPKVVELEIEIRAAHDKYLARLNDRKLARSLGQKVRFTRKNMERTKFGTGSIGLDDEWLNNFFEPRGGDSD